MSIFSRFFKKEVPAAPASSAEFNFKQRVEAFWVWYASVADRFYQTIEASQCEALAGEVSRRVHALLPGMAWVFGPGEGRVGHSFTLSGEGILPKQMLAAHWLSQAPKIDGWTFHADRQSSEEPGVFELVHEKVSFKPIEFWVTPEIDEEEERVGISVWHPLAEQVEKRMCHMALFLMLDEIFGEFGTCRWIGGTEFSKAKLGASMPITELKEFVEAARAERGWKMHTPGDTWSTYRIPPERRNTTDPRGDTIAGSSGCWEPLRDFLNDPHEMEDPFAAAGADWIYLSFPTAVLPKKGEVDAREQMTDVIEEALASEQAGRALGGAIGTERSYIDLLIYDGSRSIDIIREAARRAGLPPDTRLEYLAAEKRNKGSLLFG